MQMAITSQSRAFCCRRFLPGHCRQMTPTLLIDLLMRQRVKWLTAIGPLLSLLGRRNDSWRSINESGVAVKASAGTANAGGMTFPCAASGSGCPYLTQQPSGRLNKPRPKLRTMFSMVVSVGSRARSHSRNLSKRSFSPGQRLRSVPGVMMFRGLNLYSLISGTRGCATSRKTM